MNPVLGVSERVSSQAFSCAVSVVLTQSACLQKIPPLKYGVDPRPGWQMQAACDRREAAGKWAVQRGVRMEGSPYVFALTLDELEYAF